MIPSSPAPTPSTAASPPAIAASPSSLSFASGSAQTLDVSESGYTGGFTESDTCNPFSGEIAAVSAGSNGNGAATYAITPVAAGTCTVTVTDASNRTIAVQITVSTAAISVQRIGR